MATEAEIKKMKRGELNELAGKYGINADEYKRADDLKSAIFKQLKAESKSEPKTDKPAKPLKKAAASKKAAEDKPAKPKHNPPKPRIERRSKRYRKAHEQIEKGKLYTLEEAVDLAIKTSTVSFDAAVELHINLGVDPKQADQLVRGTVELPHGSGKTQKVAAIAPDSLHQAIKKAGADLVGHQDVIEAIQKGKADFDILVAHPDVMKDLSKLAKILGPKGLMPSPKAKTVTEDVAQTVSELKAGRIEFRVDRYGIIHQIVGRTSFKPQQLADNIKLLVSNIASIRPSSTKGTYLQRAYLTTSMGPSIKIDVSTLTQA